MFSTHTFRSFTQLFKRTVMAASLSLSILIAGPAAPNLAPQLPHPPQLLQGADPESASATTAPSTRPTVLLATAGGLTSVISATANAALPAALRSSADQLVNPAPGSWLHPAGTTEAPVRLYDPPASRYGAGHRGVDFASPDGQILAPADGVVSFVGVVVNRKVLTIDHGGGYKSSFEPIDTDLRRGERVSAGAFIGTVGEYMDDGAHCPGLCFHWGVRLDGDYVNPLPLLGGFAPSVLLPVGDR